MRIKLILVLGILTICIICGITSWYRWEFPYGQRPCALPCTMQGLWMYANQHERWFPSQTNSSNTLDLLRELVPGYVAPGVLAGVSGNVSKVRQCLETGRAIDSSISSWVYWQGFRADDDPRLAIIWERAEGVNGIGQRSLSGGHAVGFADGTYRQIAKTDWAAFVKSQEVLRAKVVSGRKADLKK